MTRDEMLECIESPSSSEAQKQQCRLLLEQAPIPPDPPPPAPAPVTDWFLESLKRGGETSPNAGQEEIDLLAANAASYRYIDECNTRLVAACEEVAKLHPTDINLGNVEYLVNEEMEKRIWPSKGYRSVLSSAVKATIWPPVVPAVPAV